MHYAYNVEWISLHWQINALLMLEPSVVTPQNQYFPANSERMSGVQNPRPWEISWASGSVFSNTSLLLAVYGYNTQFNGAMQV